MSRLILVRHGQSVWNASNRFTGWTDVGLSEQGVDNINPNICQLTPSLFSLVHTLLGEADISPTSEAVGGIPD
jgi:bisphosphoglycerate-dependent phosphoglycerate mutase